MQVIAQDGDGKLTALAVAPQGLAAAAALDSGVFRALNVEEAVPETWEERAKLAWEYYTEEPIVKNAVNAWRTFAIGDEVGLNCEDEDVEAEAVEFAERVGLETFVRDMVLQLLVKGDCVGYKTYTDKGDDIAAVQCINPVSVKLKYVQGELTEVKQFPEEGAIGEGISLPLEQLLHLKWDAPSFSPRGNSMVLPAFHAIALLRDYRKSESAIARRWTTPLRFVQVGGQFGSKLVMPDQGMLDKVRDMLNRMDLKSGVVVPFYCDVKTYGTEGEVLKTEDKVKEIKEDIIVALGLARSIVTGDGPNFATASVSMQKEKRLGGGLRAPRPTGPRRGCPSFGPAARRTQGRAQTFADAPGSVRGPAGPGRCRWQPKVSEDDTTAVVVVLVRRVVPVPVRGTAVRGIVVPGTAPQDAKASARP